MDIIRKLIDDDKLTYKCYDELKRLLISDEKFRKIIEEGYAQNMIRGFSGELWEKIRSQNIRVINNFVDVFIDGANIGYCTVAAKQLSYSLDRCYLCGGILPILKNSKNCLDGSHTWILCEGKIIDTTLMLIIDYQYSSKVGYIEENRYDPNLDPVYTAAKEFTRDPNLRIIPNKKR